MASAMLPIYPQKFNHHPPPDYGEYHFEIQVLNGYEKFTHVSPPSIADLAQIIETAVIPRSKFRAVLTKYKWSLWFKVNTKTCKVKSDEHLKELIDNSTEQWYCLRILFEDVNEYNGMTFLFQNRLLHL